MAEDDPVYRHLLQSWLQGWDYKVTLAEDGAAAWSELQADHHPRLVLLDWMMPGLDGVEICRRVRALQREAYSYIIVVTSKAAKQDAIDALDAGADDYLIKPLEANELRARMQVGTRILRLQDELLRSREQLRFRATHDALTGIWNRRHILQLLQEEMVRGARMGMCVGALMLDLDRFKVINDTHGHQVGDAVLAEVAGRVVHAVRCYDKVGRYGGEEFLVVLPDCSGDMLGCIAERIRARVAAKPILNEGVEIRVSVSIGGAVANPDQPSDPALLIRNADRALYLAKEAGRNRCIIDAEVTANCG
ncbi:MAG TPA: diguanylate cyclase, partial [Terriglobales bacterium]|nr:diguanylate cyclase [Terriglobales bacterium]